MTESVRIADLRSRGRQSEGFIVAPFPDQKLAREIVNKRRGASLSVPGLSWRGQDYAQEALFKKFSSHGLEHYLGCITAEMYSRPVPHVFPEKETEAITALFSKWAPLIYDRILSEIKPPVATLNKTSRLGWPVFKSPLSKRAAVTPHFDRLMHDDLGYYKDSFIIQNVRLQPEPVEKKREFLFVKAAGEVYSRTVDRAARTIKRPGGERTCSRTRLVFNLPIPNLFTQVLDSAIHNALLKYPVFHHDMYSRTMTRFTGHTLFFDVKHMERATARCVRVRSQIIGGMYGQIGELFADIPFLCPSDDWKSFQLLWVDRDRGWSDQFASGYSPVAPAQKEIFWALYAEFASHRFGMDSQTALNWVLAGGDDKLRILNYGDDNALGGDPEVMNALFEFMKQYLHVEIEEPPKFLGFLHTLNGWKLGVQSYLLKTYLNERMPGSNFRKFPFWGWVLKRKTYREYGVDELFKEVFPEEDAILARIGLPWTTIQEEAVIEAARAQEYSGMANSAFVHEKDYLLTPEEKIATGLFEGFEPVETAPMIKKLLDKKWTDRLSW